MREVTNSTTESQGYSTSKQFIWQSSV